MAEQQGLSTHRIEGLTDGIFAFAMTLLVLELQFPDASVASGGQLTFLIFGQMHRLYNFLLSFFLLAIFWVAHNQHYHHIRKTTPLLLWINILLLCSVVLIPFSTSLIGDFESQPLAELIFAGNIFVVGILFLANWAYAARNKLLTDVAFEKGHVFEGIIQNLVTPVVALLVMASIPFIPGWSSYLFFLIPIFLTWRGIVRKRRK